MKNIVLLGCKAPAHWEFLESLEQATGERWIPWEAVNRIYGGFLRNVIRYIKYFLAPLRVVLHRKEYAKVLAWQQFYGLILAFYFRILKVKNTPSVTIMCFIYRPKKYVGKLYERFIHFALGSDCIRKIIVFSESEVKHYSSLFGVRENMFTAVRLAIEDTTNRIPRKKPGEYFLSAGRSNRDYPFLIAAWRPEYGKLKIVCDTLHGRVDTDGIEYLDDCYGDAYMELLAGCYAVVISLDNEEISSGQLVMLQALMYGKPVIITRNKTVLEYLADGEDGYIIPKDPSQLGEAVEAVKKNYSILSRNARKHFEERFSLSSLGHAVGKTFL